MIIEAIGARRERTTFDCGEPSLNEYLIRYALQNDAKGLGRTFVAVEPPDDRVRGYYTLSSGSVHFDTIPANLPAYPIPVVHLGRLAVDLASQGQGIGEELLVDALRRACAVAERVGVYAVEVRALTDQARTFYLRYGFAELKDDRLHLYLPMKTIRKAGI